MSFSTSRAFKNSEIFNYLTLLSPNYQVFKWEEFTERVKLEIILFQYNFCPSLISIQIPLVLQLFDTLHALCNLLVVAPDNLKQVCSGEQLANLDKNILHSFVQLRADYRSARLARHFSWGWIYKGNVLYFSRSWLTESTGGFLWHSQHFMEKWLFGKTAAILSLEILFEIWALLNHILLFSLKLNLIPFLNLEISNSVKLHVIVFILENVGVRRQMRC